MSRRDYWDDDEAEEYVFDCDPSDDVLPWIMQIVGGAVLVFLALFVLEPVLLYVWSFLRFAVPTG